MKFLTSGTRKEVERYKEKCQPGGSRKERVDVEEDEGIPAGGGLFGS